MKLICKQCGKEYTITDGEKEFYKNKNLALPKRCKKCRNSNKKKRNNFKVVENKEFDSDEVAVMSESKDDNTSDIKNNTSKNKKNTFFTGLATLAVVAAVGVGNLIGGNTQGATALNKDIAVTKDVSEESKQNSLSFRNNELFYSHYEKHGEEMGFESADEYLKAANAVVNNPDVLHKYEKEDGDDVYFLEATGEFVVVSTDGYIRTYYIADKDYFDRQ